MQAVLKNITNLSLAGPDLDASDEIGTTQCSGQSSNEAPPMVEKDIIAQLQAVIQAVCVSEAQVFER